MKKQYLTQPLLVNPSKWLRSKKWHQSDLYRHGYYDSNSMTYNPFALALMDTKSDGTMVRFPRGNMIELIVESVPEWFFPSISESESESVSKSKSKSGSESKNSNSGSKRNKEVNQWIVPVLEGLDKKVYYYTSNYIINNARYASYVATEGRGLYFRFYPRKLSYKNSNVNKNQVKLMPDFVNIIRSYLETNIAKELATTSFSTSMLKEQGIKLSNTGPLFKFDQIPTINIQLLLPDYNLNQDLFISYKDNSWLCKNLIDLVNFKS
jgi:hypothetical protein